MNKKKITHLRKIRKHCFVNHFWKTFSEQRKMFIFFGFRTRRIIKKTRILTSSLADSLTVYLKRPGAAEEGGIYSATGHARSRLEWTVSINGAVTGGSILCIIYKSVCTSSSVKHELRRGMEKRAWRRRKPNYLKIARFSRFLVSVYIYTYKQIIVYILPNSDSKYIYCCNIYKIVLYNNYKKCRNIYHNILIYLIYYYIIIIINNKYTLFESSVCRHLRRGTEERAWRRREPNYLKIACFSRYLVSMYIYTYKQVIVYILPNSNSKYIYCCNIYKKV